MNEQHLQMGFAIVLARLVMVILLAKRRQMLQPLLNVLDQAAFVFAAMVGFLRFNSNPATIFLGDSPLGACWLGRPTLHLQ